ncbi:MAG: DNA/RNA nuclease SfsA [Hyperthermus sp.]|nr:MAG: DNA/RNA nuclease SfsA [Hyperthermus sp.]
MSLRLIGLNASDIIECRVVGRINRFTVSVEAGGSRINVHINNTGKLPGVLVYGNKGLCLPTSSGRLGYRLFAIECCGGFALIDTRLQERSVLHAIMNNLVPWLKPCRPIAQMPRYKDCILDFLLECTGENVLVETKSAVLRDPQGYALYPDTPSRRGRRHVECLRHATKNGYRSVLVFVAAFPNARGFKPNMVVDGRFGELLRTAMREGVDVRGIGLHYNPDSTSVEMYDPDLKVVV